MKLHRRLLSVIVIIVLIASAISVVNYNSGSQTKPGSMNHSQNIDKELGQFSQQFSPLLTLPMVEFNETGLPTGTQWSVNISGTSYSSLNQSIKFHSNSGTYHYRIQNQVNFYTPSPQGQFTISSQNVLIQVNFHGKLSITGYENLNTKQKVVNYSSLSTNQSVFPVYGISDGYSHNYVVLGYSNSEVYLINQSDPSLISNFKGPSSPVAVDYNIRNGNLYILNSTTLFMYNSTGTLLASTYLGGYLISVAYNPSNGQVLVGNLYGGIFFIDGTTLSIAGTMKDITVFNSQSFAYNTVLNQMEVINDTAQNGNIVFLNELDKPVSIIKATGTLVSLTYNPSTDSSYYVSLRNSVSNTYVLNNTGSHLIPGTANSSGLGVSIGLDSILITNTQNNTVELVNSSTNEVTYVIQGAGVPLLPLSGPDNSSFFVVNPLEDALDVISTNDVVVKIDFRAYGFDASTNWAVTVNDVNLNSTDASIQFFEIPGLYNYTIDPVSGYATPLPGKFNATGSEINVSIHFSELYAVTFMETGLLSGTTWSLNLSGSSVSADWNSNITFSLPNGTYSFIVPATSGFVSSPGSGHIIVKGSSITVKVNFSTTSHIIDFISLGLPTGMVWMVHINGVMEETNGTSLSYSAITGTYNYYISSVSGFHPDIPSGTIHVSSSNITVNVTWLPYLYEVNFTESGLPSGSAWSIYLSNNVYLNSSQSNVTAELQNGTYSYTFASADSNWTGSSGTFEVSGKNIQLNLDFVPVLYRVNFTETGLNSGTYWSVMVSGYESVGTYESSTHLYLHNGTYSYSAETSNVTFQTVSGQFTINGSNITVNLYFQQKEFNVTFVESGLAGGITWGVYIPGYGNHTTQETFMNVSLSVGQYSYAPLPVPGYNTTPGGVLNILGGNLTVVLNYTPVQQSTVQYNVTIYELGLPESFHWSVSLNNTTEVTNSDGFFSYHLANGTYNLSIESINPHGKVFSLNYNLKLIVFGTNQFIYVIFYGPYPWLMIDLSVHANSGFHSGPHHHEDGFNVAQDLVLSTRF